MDESRRICEIVNEIESRGFSVESYNTKEGKTVLIFEERNTIEDRLKKNNKAFEELTCKKHK